jgi:phage terminase large subunit-like protein
MPGSVEATENAIIERRLTIAQNDVLTWNVASVCMVPDAQGNRKPHKLKSTGRIDGALALIQAIGLYTAAPEAVVAPRAFRLSDIEAACRPRPVHPAPRGIQ